LRRLQEITGVGTLRRHAARGTTRPIVQWRASAVSELRRLVAIFDRYPLRSRKARDYAIWREAVLLLSQPPSRERAERLRRLKAELHAARAYRQQGGEEAGSDAGGPAGPAPVKGRGLEA